MSTDMQVLVGPPSDESEAEEEQAERTTPVGRSWNRYAAEGYQIVHNNNNNNKSGLAVQDGENGGRSKAEKQLCVILVVSLLFIVGLLVGLVVINLRPDAIESPARCETPDCVILAGSMLSMMDLTVDPCEDFYSYSCSAFVNNPTIPPSSVKYGAFSEVGGKIVSILKRILDEPGTEYRGVNSSAIEKVKEYYNTCLNRTATESIPNSRLLKVIRDLGSWPVLNDSVSGPWDSNTWDMDHALAQTFRYIANALFNFDIGTDQKDSTKQRFQIDQGGLTFKDEESYKNNGSELHHTVFVKYFKSIAVLLGSANDGNLQKDAEDVWAFEVALAKAFESKEARVNPEFTYHKMTVAEAHKLFDGVVDLPSFIKEATGTSFPASEVVIVYAPNYIRRMSALVKAATKRTLANYITWQTVRTFVTSMPSNFLRVLEEVNQVLTGATPSGVSWAKCVEDTNHILGFATGALYTERYFSAEDKKNVEAVLARIRKAFLANLPHVPWMDEQTKAKAIEKEKGIGQKIGYPEYIRDPTLLDQHYANLNITLNSPFDNELSSRQFILDNALDKLGKPTDHSRWSMVPAEVNAYYSPSLNEIVFPAGILQKPFYNKTFPLSVLYGILGMVIGHELTHGFDNTGRLYDIHGNLNSWWTNKSAEGFLNRSQCIVKEYDKFVVENEHLNGQTTLAENIADNGGLKTAYKAYMSRVSEEGHQELPLPGLNMTHAQQFFLSFGQLWCTYYTPKFALTALNTDPHSNTRYRVIGTVRNMPEFSEAYQCPLGSKMNPEKKCAIW